MNSSAAKSTGSRCRSGSNGHFWGFVSARKCWSGSLARGLRLTPRAAPRSETIQFARPRRDWRFARTGRTTSITGTARASSFPQAPNCWPRAVDFPVEAFQVDHAFGLQFHPDVTYAMMHRWTTRGDARLELPGARPRHHHFDDRAVHDASERAWLKQFIEGWLARVPFSVMSEAAE